MGFTVPVPWWLDHLVMPVLFTFIGAILGFFTGRLKDTLDDRKAKGVFLRAIRVELTVVRTHLQGTLKDASETKNQLGTSRPRALHLVTTFQTGIYSSQIGKLRDVFDPLVIEAIQFYDRLANLERVKSRLTVVSFELATGIKEPDKVEATAVHYRDTLDEIIKRINQLLPEADVLISKLPKG